MKPAEAERDEGAVNPRSCVAIALVSCAVLVYEIAITRILSVVLWYHFAFLAISLALLGLGLPGVWFAIKAPGRWALAVSLIAAAIAAPASLAFLFHFGGVVAFQSAVPGLHVALNSRLPLVVVCVLCPLLCFGSAVCLLLMSARERAVGWLYGADLLGATLGALAVVPLMHVLPTPVIVAGTGLLPLIALALCYRRLTTAALALAATSLALLFWGAPFKLTFSKSYVEPKNIVYEKWTPTARITIFPDIFYVKHPNDGFGWGMGDKYEPQRIRQMWIEQDGSAGTPITHLETQPQALTHLFFDVTSVGYQLRPPKTACVIGAGGGRDVLTALKAGAGHVDAVELNGAIVDALSGPLRDFSGDPYHRPGVHAHVSEGRSFLTRTQRNYDLIQISLIDSWAATAAGAYSLSENYLYTVEALRLYLRRTAPGGLVSISRWVTGERELEGARLAGMISHALELEGVGEPAKHLAVMQAWSVGTFLFSRTAFSAADLASLRQIAETRGFRQRWPAENDDAKQAIVASALLDTPDSYREPGVDLSPATDDRPFFFQTVSPFGNIDDKKLNRLSNNEHSVAMLRFLFWTVGALTLALFFTPLILKRTLGARGPRPARNLWQGSIYFMCIGLGFMLVEIPWLQRFVLYLGHPSYATTVVLTSLLLGAGCGALLTTRTEPATLARYGFALPLVIVFANMIWEPMFSATLGWGFAARAVLSALALIPAGALMGFAFPGGLRSLSDGHTAWFWAVNGAAGVLASIISLMLAIAFGFQVTVLVGAGFYVVAWAILHFAVRSQVPARVDVEVALGPA